MRKLKTLRVEETPDKHQIGVTKYTFDRMLSVSNAGDAIALYFFYAYTSKWQATKKIKCATRYAATGLKWSQYRVRKAKKSLLDLELIEDVVRRTEDNKKISGWYIQVFHLVEGETYSPKINTVDNLQSANSDTNASGLIKKCFNTHKENACEEFSYENEEYDEPPF